MSECKRPFKQRKNKRTGETGKGAPAETLSIDFAAANCLEKATSTSLPLRNSSLRLTVSQGNVNFNNHTCTHTELQQQTTTTRKRVRLELLNSTAILCARFHLSLFWCVCIILCRQRASYIFASKKGKEAATAAAKQTTTTHFLSSVLYRHILLLFHIFPAMSVEKSKKEGKRICNTSHILVVWRHSSAKKEKT